MMIEKRIETASEVITVDSNNVVHVERKGCTMPRNFSFAAIGGGVPAAAAVVPSQYFTLFINDVRLDVSTSYNRLYEIAWTLTDGRDVNSVIIC